MSQITFQKFYQGFIRDASILGWGTEYPEWRAIRMAAIYARFIGAYCQLEGVSQGLKLLTFTSSPGLAIARAIAAIAFFVLGHDLVVIGFNKSEMMLTRIDGMRDALFESRNFFERAYHFGSNFFSHREMALEEGIRQSPVELHGTWAAERIYFALNQDNL